MINDELTTIEQNNLEFSDDYLEALEATPVEVRNFMWSEAFTLILTAIGETFKLSDEQREVVKRVTMETLVGTITPIGRRVRLSDAGMMGELQDNILEAINDEIISRALVQVELATEKESEVETTDEKDGIGPKDTTDAPSPMQALASIQERLTKPSTLAPITRDYSVSRPETTTPKQNDVANKQPSIDIYRELPEE